MTIKYPLGSQFSIKGFWWIPDSDRKIAGEIHYTVEGLDLELYDELNGKSAKALFPSNRDDKFSIIYGESLNGEQITLIDSFNTKTNFRGSGYNPSDLVVNKMMIGTHLDRHQEKFTECSIHVPSLELWLNLLKNHQKRDYISANK